MAAADILNFGKCQYSELDRAICTKCGGQMYHGNVDITK